MKAKTLLIFAVAAVMIGCNGEVSKSDRSHFSGCDPNLNDLHYPKNSIKRNAPAALPKGIGFDAVFLIATATDSCRIKLVYYDEFPCGGYDFHSTCKLENDTIIFGAWTTKGRGFPDPCICPETVTYVVEDMEEGTDYTIYLQNRCYLSFTYTPETDTIFIIRASDYPEYSEDEFDSE